MDKGRRDGPHGKSSTTSPWSYDTSPFEVWHSTPVKNNVGALPADVRQVSVPSSNEMDGVVRQLARTVPPSPIDIHCHTQLQHTQMSVSDMESSTIQRQRRELQLLITELKDRDRELTTMAASHHKQLHAWEQDRQRVLSLEERCARSDGELQKRVEVIRALSRRVRALEARELDLHTELGTTQQQLQRLGREHQDMDQTSQDLQDKNTSLNSTVMALSSQVGSLQVREEELSSMLKLKDKDVREAGAHAEDLRARLQDAEEALKESRPRESRLLREVEEAKRRYREYRHENASLREELQQHVTQSSSQREEIIRLKQEHQMLCRDLAVSGEGDSWKDELLALARSKQERTESELHCLRQVCENQRRDLQLLQVNLESAREALGERSRHESAGRKDTGMVSQNILEMSREQQTHPHSQVSDTSLTAKQNNPSVFPSDTTETKEQRELEEESISEMFLDANDVPMALCELISHSNATCYLFPGRTSEGQERRPENGSAPNHETSGETMMLDSAENKSCSRTPVITSPAGRSEWTDEAQDLAESHTSETSNPGQGPVPLKDVFSSSSGAERKLRESCAPEENQFEAHFEDRTELHSGGKTASRTEMVEQEPCDFICDRVCTSEAEQSRPGKMAGCGKIRAPPEQTKPCFPATASIAEDAETFPSSPSEAASSEGSVPQTASRQESTRSVEKNRDTERETSSVGPESANTLTSSEDERVGVEDGGLASFEGSVHRSGADQTGEDRFEANRTSAPLPSSHESTSGQIRASSLRIVATGCKSISGTIRYRRTAGVPAQMGHTGVGGAEPGQGPDTQAGVGLGPGMNLVAVLRNPLQGKSSPVLSLKVRPRTPRGQNHTCEDDSLTSLPRMRSCCLAHNANRLATEDEDPELPAHASDDGRRPLGSCRLQRTPDDSQLSAAGWECGALKHKGSARHRNAHVSLSLSPSSASEAPHCHPCLKPSCRRRSSTDKVTETPPRA